MSEMNRALIFDSHVHSDNSPDGNHSITYLGIAAQEMDLFGLCVTDHCEAQAYREERYDKSIFQSVFECKKACRVFGESLKICVGIELGQPMQGIEAAKTVLDSQSFDFVLCSVHNLPGKKDFYYLNYAAMTDGDIHDMMTAYFEEVLQSAKQADFDSLAHLTYPLRYLVGEQGRAVDLERYAPAIDEILRVLAGRGKALELNTSGLRQPYGVTLPQGAVLTRFRELGGQYITIGSDAHYNQDLAAGFAQGFALAKAAGFESYAYFEGREPKTLSIV